MASSLEEDLTCPVCIDIFKDPVFLSCSHSVCKACIEKAWEGKQVIECPVCRRRLSKNLPPNLALRSLCETFLREKGRTGLCQKHKRKLELFCREDQQLVCLVCRDSKLHRDHHFSPADEVASERKEELNVKLDPLKKKLDVYNKEKLTCDKTAEHIKTQAVNTEKQIKQEFEKLHQFLQDEEAARMAALREEEEQKSQMMKEKIEEMSREISSLSDTIRGMEEEIKADDVTFLENYKSTVERAQCTLQDPESLSGALINVAKHLGNLKFRVWEKMQEIVQYTPVILDPNTACNHLILSEDLTSVRRGDEIQLPDNPERFDDFVSVLGSEGFNSGTHCWDVEVGDSPGWQVGVMTESIQRKGDYYKLSAVFHVAYREKNVDDDDYDDYDYMMMTFDGADSNNAKGDDDNGDDTNNANGDDDNYYDDYYDYDDDDDYEYKYMYRVCVTPQPSTLLTLKQKLHRIRVQLDWNGGKVTFTDPDNMTHLHTFTHTFTEKAFPFFNNGSSLPLRVLPMKASVRLEQ